MRKIVIKTTGVHSRTQQIVESYKTAIKSGILLFNDKILSINEFSKNYGYSRDTVEKAYKILRKEGFIMVLTTVGFYVSYQDEAPKTKVLLIFNKVSSYKTIVYETILDCLGMETLVDLRIHHYNPKILNDIIEENLNKYHYYVIMPHFFHGTKIKECLKSISKIPSEQLILADKDISGIEGGYSSIFQDFHLDIKESLYSNINIIRKYSGITLVLPPESHHPVEIIDGVREFCNEMDMYFELISTIKKIDNLRFGMIYLVLTEEELAYVLKKSRDQNLVLGLDVGIISFNESDLKDYLGITVVTTDFEHMGAEIAKLITSKTQIRKWNKFHFVKRQSL